MVIVCMNDEARRRRFFEAEAGVVWERMSLGSTGSSLWKHLAWHESIEAVAEFATVDKTSWT